MKTFVIRTNNARDKLIEFLKEAPLPYKIMQQPLGMKRTIDQNAYLWGVVYRRIADYSGQTTEEVHEGYKEKFRLEYSPDKKGIWKLRKRSTTEDSIYESWEYALFVRADAMVEMGLQIELPHENFVNELDFKTEVGYDDGEISASQGLDDDHLSRWETYSRNVRKAEQKWLLDEVGNHI